MSKYDYWSESKLMAALENPKAYMKAAVMAQLSRSGPMKAVRHQQTCTGCGAKLVNLYPSGKGWICKSCIEKGEENDA